MSLPSHEQNLGTRSTGQSHRTESADQPTLGCFCRGLVSPAFDSQLCSVSQDQASAVPHRKQPGFLQQWQQQQL